MCYSLDHAKLLPRAAVRLDLMRLLSLQPFLLRIFLPHLLCLLLLHPWYSLQVLSCPFSYLRLLSTSAHLYVFVKLLARVTLLIPLSAMLALRLPPSISAASIRLQFVPPFQLSIYLRVLSVKSVSSASATLPD